MKISFFPKNLFQIQANRPSPGQQSQAESGERFLSPVRFQGLFPSMVIQDVRHPVILPPRVLKIRHTAQRNVLTRELGELLEKTTTGNFWERVRLAPQEVHTTTFRLAWKRGFAPFQIRVRYIPKNTGKELYMAIGPQATKDLGLTFSLNDAFQVNRLTVRKDPFNIWGVLLHDTGKQALAETIGTAAVKGWGSSTDEEAYKAYATQDLPLHYLPNTWFRFLDTLKHILEKAYTSEEQEPFFQEGYEIVCCPTIADVMLEKEAGESYRGNERTVKRIAGECNYKDKKIRIAAHVVSIEDVFHHEMGHWVDHYLSRKLFSTSEAFTTAFAQDFMGLKNSEKRKLLAILGFSPAKRDEAFKQIQNKQLSMVLVNHVKSELLADLHSALKCRQTQPTYVFKYQRDYQNQVWLLEHMIHTTNCYKNAYEETFKVPLGNAPG